MICNCELFEEGVKEIDRFILAAYARNNTDTYNAPRFTYCPWCGSQLIFDEIFDEEEVK